MTSTLHERTVMSVHQHETGSPTTADEPMQRAVQAVELELMRTPVVKRLKAGRRIEIARRIVDVLKDLGLLSAPDTQKNSEPRANG